MEDGWNFGGPAMIGPVAWIKKTGARTMGEESGPGLA
jgi:hypothetical protein